MRRRLINWLPSRRQQPRGAQLVGEVARPCDHPKSPSCFALDSGGRVVVSCLAAHVSIGGPRLTATPMFERCRACTTRLCISLCESPKWGRSRGSCVLRARPKKSIALARTWPPPDAGPVGLQSALSLLAESVCASPTGGWIVRPQALPWAAVAEQSALGVDRLGYLSVARVCSALFAVDTLLTHASGGARLGAGGAPQALGAHRPRPLAAASGAHTQAGAVAPARPKSPPRTAYLTRGGLLPAASHGSRSGVAAMCMLLPQRRQKARLGPPSPKTHIGLRESPCCVRGA